MALPNLKSQSLLVIYVLYQNKKTAHTKKLKQLKEKEKILDSPKTNTKKIIIKIKCTKILLIEEEAKEYIKKTKSILHAKERINTND